MELKLKQKTVYLVLMIYDLAGNFSDNSMFGIEIIING